MTVLPYSDRIGVRPVLYRAFLRLCDIPLNPPSDEEKQDAIRVLEQRTLTPDDPVGVEALRILEEA